jgi:hypothetical protein
MSRRESEERHGDGEEHCGDDGLYLMGVGAEIEMKLKNEIENETENDHFRNSDRMV